MMKYIFFRLFTVALILLNIVACEISTLEYDSTLIECNTIMATTASSQTKVSFEQNDKTNAIDLKWEDGDTFEVEVDDNVFVDFTYCSSSDDGKSAYFKSSESLSEGTYFAYYNRAATLDNQTSEDINSLNDACRMVAEFTVKRGEIPIVNFNHLSAVMAFKFTSEIQPSKLVFKNGDAQYAVSGLVGVEKDYIAYIMIEPCNSLERKMVFTLYDKNNSVYDVRSVTTSKAYRAGYKYTANFTDDFENEVFSGEGTENNPYLLTSKKNVEYLIESVDNGESFEGSYFKLTSDITLDYMIRKECVTIGSQNTPFLGVVDGDGYTISGVYFSEEYGYSSLFQGIQSSAQFKDIDIKIGNSETIIGLDAYGLYAVDAITYSKTPSQDTQNISDAYNYIIGVADNSKDVDVKLEISDLYGCAGWSSGCLSQGVWLLNDGPFVFTANENNGYKVSLSKVNLSDIMSDIQVVKNPYGGNPLAAQITFSSSSKLAPVMTLVGRRNNDIVREFPLATEHVIDVLGLYNNYVNTVFVECVMPNGLRVKKEFKIDVLYDNIICNVTTEFTENLNNDPAHIYLTSGGASNFKQVDSDGCKIRSVGFDQYGEIRMCLISSDPPGNAFLNYVGDISCVTYITGDMSSSNVCMVNYMGKEEKVLSCYMPHHEVRNIDANTIVVASKKDDSNLSLIKVYDLSSGDCMQTIDLEDIIDPDRDKVFARYNKSDDRLHINAVDYDSSDDAFIVSMRLQGVAKIDRNATDKSGLHWWMTPHTDVADDWKSTLLTPENFANEQNEWNQGNHSTRVMPDGGVLMFDNHNPDDGNEQIGGSRILVMGVDEENMTVTNSYEWRSEAADFSKYMSSADYHPESNTIVAGYSVQRTVYEITYDENKEMLFKGVFYSGTDKDANMYRFYKINLYDKHSR